MREIDYEKTVVGYVKNVRSGLQPTSKSRGTVYVENWKTFEILDFKFDSSQDIAAAFEEMKQINMPIGVYKTETCDVFVGSFLRQVKSVEPITGGYSVVFVNLQSIEHFLSKKNPDLEGILKRLEDSKQNKVEYWITSLDEWGALPVVLQAIPAMPPVECDLNYVPTQFMESNARPIPPGNADDLFNFLNSYSVTPASASLDGLIPFRFVSEGCRERAHRSAELLLDVKRIESIKVWAFVADSSKPFISIPTDQHPNCKVEWQFHVASAVLTHAGYFVLDPSTCASAVPLADWYCQLNNGNTLLYATSRIVFDTSVNQCKLRSDPECKSSKFRLKIFGINLVLLWSIYGSSPCKCS